jgi:hypothetical protein
MFLVSKLSQIKTAIVNSSFQQTSFRALLKAREMRRTSFNSTLSGCSDHSSPNRNCMKLMLAIVAQNPKLSMKSKRPFLSFCRIMSSAL